MAGIDNSMTISLYSPVLRQLRLKNIGVFSHIVSFTGWFFTLHLYFFWVLFLFKNRCFYKMKNLNKWMAAFIRQYDNATFAWMLLRIRSWNIACWTSLYSWCNNWFINSSCGYSRYYACGCFWGRLLSHCCCYSKCCFELWFYAYSGIFNKIASYG